MIAWPNNLVAEIARRRSVIFLGAGVSMQCTNAAGQSPKCWEDLLDAAVAQVPVSDAKKKRINRLIKSGDFLTACEVIREQMGTHAFHQFLQQELLVPNFQPAPIHDSLIQLGSRIYATPNFDKVFENKAAAIPNNAFQVKNYYDEDVANVAKGIIPVILKFHGTIDYPDQMIFTRGDYTKARNHYSRFYDVFEALCLTHTLLFVGCGLNDPDIKLILEDHAFIHKWSAPHYFVISKGTVPQFMIPAIQQTLNIHLLEYSGGHAQLKPELDGLVNAVNLKRNDIQLNRSW